MSSDDGNDSNSSAFLMELAQKYNINTKASELELAEGLNVSSEHSTNNVSEGILSEEDLEKSSTNSSFCNETAEMLMGSIYDSFTGGEGASKQLLAQGVNLSNRQEMQVFVTQLQHQLRHEIERRASESSLWTQERLIIGKKMESMRNGHELQVHELQTQLDTVKREAAGEKTALRRDMATYDVQIRKNETLTKETIAQLEKRIKELETSHPTIGDQVDMIKNSLRDLQLGESSYLAFKTLPESQQSIKEFVCIQVFELLQVEKKKQQRLQAEANDARDKMIEAEAQAGKTAQLHKRSEQKNKDLQAEVTALEESMTRLRKQLQDKTQKLSEVLGKEERFDRLQADYDALRRDNSELKQQQLIHSANVQSLTADRSEMHEKYQANDSLVELLKMDKMYLSKSVEDWTARCHSYEKENTRLLDKIRQGKENREALSQQLLMAREESKNKFEDRLSAELLRMKEVAAQDLDQLRTNQRDGYERELRVMRTLRDELVVELDREKTTAYSVLKSYEQLQNDHRKLQTTLETSLSEMRSSLKMKTFEGERLGLQYEECLADVRKFKLENEMLGKKNEVLKTEYYSLQNDKMRAVRTLEMQVEDLEGKLKQYEALEYELDVTALHSQWTADEQNQNKENRETGLDGLLASITDTMPVDSKLRVQQSVKLARALVHKQRQLDACHVTIKEQQQQLQEAEERCESLRRSVGAIDQPASYFIATVEQKNMEVKQAMKEINRLNGQCQRLTEQHNESVKTSTELKQDLQKLLDQNTGMMLLKEHLSQLLAANNKALVATGRNDSITTQLAQAVLSSAAFSHPPATTSTCAKPLLSSITSLSTPCTPCNNNDSSSSNAISNPTMQGFRPATKNPAPLWFKKLEAGQLVRHGSRISNQ